MAPDLNSLPPSPYSPRHFSSTNTRRPQEPMAPSSIPTSPPARSPSMITREATTSIPPGDNTGVGVGPGPLRHPRPLTAADLHMQLEKEQEAVVNRLTRELSLLRQQTASVASNTSSTSVGLQDSTDHNATPSRRHRSSSSLSNRSATTAATAVTGASGSTVGTTVGIAGSTTSGIAPARDSTAPYSYPRDPLSRQSSVTSRRSETSSPSLSSSLYQGDHFSNPHGHRHTGSASHSQLPSQVTNPASARSSYIPATQRYEEAAHHRSELDIVKRENEALRRRVRELERSLSSRRASVTESSRRDSASTNASVPPQSRSATVDDEDVVILGESADIVGVDVRH